MSPGHAVRCPSCAEVAQGAANYCWRCGKYLTVKKSRGWLLAVAIVVLVLWGFVSFVKSNMPYTFNEVEAGTYGAVITMAEFDRIQTGMSYREVWSIIGTNGEQIGESSIAGHETESYSWKNPNGSNMIAMFQDGRLI